MLRYYLFLVLLLFIYLHIFFFTNSDYLEVKFILDKFLSIIEDS